MVITGASEGMPPIILSKTGPQVKEAGAVIMTQKEPGKLPITKMVLYGIIANERGSVIAHMANLQITIKPIYRFSKIISANITQAGIRK